MTQKTQILENSKILHIPESRFESFKEELKKVEKKFKKYGATLNLISDPPGTHTGTKIIVHRDGNESFEDTTSYKYYGRKVRVEFDLPQIKAKGYKFLFTLERTESLNAIYSSIDYTMDKKDHTKYSKSDFYCDHCKTNRLRNRVHVFEKGSKRFMIANTCSKPYFGESTYKLLSNLHKVYDNSLQIFSGFCSDDDEEFGGKGFMSPSENYGELEIYVQKIFYVILHKGFISKSKAEDSMSMSMAQYKPHYNNDVLTATCEEVVSEDKPYKESCEKHNFSFNELLKFCESKLDVDGEKFELFNNIMIELNNPSFFKEGLITYAVFLYMLEKEVIESYKKKEIKILDEWVDGDVGSKVSIKVKVNRIHTVESFYGMSDLVMMEDEDGRQVKTFYSGYNEKLINKMNESINNGTYYTMNGTIKKKDWYNEIKQTMVSRFNLK